MVLSAQRRHDARISLYFILAVGVIDQLIIYFILSRPPHGFEASNELLWNILPTPYALVLAGGGIAALLTLSYRRGYSFMPVGFILGGYLSNVLTIISRGRFIDYIPVSFWQTNSADGAIILGLVWLAFELCSRKNEESSNGSKVG